MKHAKRNGTDSGFTLIELMITVAIVAILAAIAVPAYSKYVLRAGRTEAISALQQLAAAQERYRLDHNKYALSLDELKPVGFTINGTGAGAYAFTENRKFSLHLMSPTTKSFTMEARTYGNQANDSCNYFRLTHLNVKSVGAGDAASCWK